MSTTATPDTSVNPATVALAAETARLEAHTFVEMNRVLVTDQSSLERARAVRVAIGEKQKKIVADLQKPKAWANSLHKWFCGLETACLAPYEALDRLEAAQIKEYDAAVARANEARERELAEQRKQEDQDRAASVAAAFEADGEPEIAAAVIAEAIAAPLPVVVIANPVRAVQRFRRSYKWRLKNESLVPRGFLMLDTVKLNKYAVAMKESAIGSVAGIEFYHVDDPIR